MTYKLKSLDIGLRDWPTSLTLLRDIDETARAIDDKSEPADKTELRAQAASGDYFATLATRLDQVSQSIKADNTDHVILESSIEELLYLQEHHRIVKK